MALMGFTRRFKPLEMLSEEQVHSIHRATLDVLKNTGLKIEHKKALQILEKNGCNVNYDEMRVRFPEGLVEESLRKAPTSFRVKARDPKNDLIIGGTSLYFYTFPGMQTVDLETWEPRVATRKENYDMVTVMDALENLHFMSPYTPYYGFEGISSAMVEPESYAARIRNSSKAQMTAYNLDAEIFTIKMAQVVNSELFCTCMVSPPLTYYKDAIDCLFMGIEAGFPIWVNSGAVMGGTGPATIAGSTVTTNAELIGPIVLAQLLSPGTRIVVAHFIFPLNMRNGAPAFGSIGSSLHQVVFNQMWRKYGIPASDDIMGLTNSKIIDFQDGYEKAVGAFIAAISGANMIQLYNGIYGEIAAHPVQAVLDDDVAGMIGRFLESVEVNDETLAIDLINEVGPIPGYYLDSEHTRKWWKNEQYIPKCADTLTYPEWMETGKKSAIDYAKERLDEILSSHTVSLPLTEEQDSEIEKILQEARNYYKQKGLL
ncbi:MAG: trimethylamine methyltransferase family protein [Actinobacteria bacterium]|nr:trimethylamine methyltransferase family protein [Actinomycetota bacterium]